MRFSLLIFCLSILFSSSAQQLLTVDECLQTALAENLDLRQAENNIIAAKTARLRAVFNYLPAVNVGGGYYSRNGNYFDNSVDKFITSTTKSFNAGVTTGILLFNGFRNKHDLQSSNYALKATEAGFEQQKQEVMQNVLQAYLNVLVDQKTLEIYNERIAQLEQQYDRATKREAIGVGGIEDVYLLESQLSTERVNQVNAVNQVQADKLQLLQLMRLDPNEDYSFEAFQADSLNYQLPESAAQLYQMLMADMPSLQVAEANFQSAKYDFRSSYAAFFPIIEGFYYYGSSYSSNGAIDPETGENESNVPFREQFDYNAVSTLGIEFTIPIFNRWQNKSRWQTAKVGMLNAQLELEKTNLEVVNLSQQLYQDLYAANASFQAALTNQQTANKSFEFMGKRYAAGHTDFYTYLESLNNKSQSLLQLAQAKYAVIIRNKMLEVYLNMDSFE